MTLAPAVLLHGPVCAFSLRACAHSALNGNSHLAAVCFLVTLQPRVVSFLFRRRYSSRAEQLSGSGRFKYQRGQTVAFSQCDLQTSDAHKGAGVVRTPGSARWEGMLPVNTQVSLPVAESRSDPAGSPSRSPSGSPSVVPRCQVTPTLAEPLIGTCNRDTQPLN